MFLHNNRRHTPLLNCMYLEGCHLSASITVGKAVENRTFEMPFILLLCSVNKLTLLKFQTEMSFRLPSIKNEPLVSEHLFTL